MVKRSVKSNRAIRALLLSNSLILISLAMFVPVYALFVQKVGGGALSAGLTAGALAFTSGLSALISGRLIDKLKPGKTKQLMALGWLLIGVVMLMYLFVHSLKTLFIVQILAGAVKTISAPAFDTLYARHLDRGSSGREYGLWEASFFATAGIGAVIGGFLVANWGFTGVFLSMSALAFLASFYIFSLPKNAL